MFEIAHTQTYPRSLLGQIRYSWKYMGSYPWDYDSYQIDIDTNDGYFLTLYGYRNWGFDRVEVYTSAEDRRMKTGGTIYAADIRILRTYDVRRA